MCQIDKYLEILTAIAADGLLHISADDFLAGSNLKMGRRLHTYVPT